METLTVLAIFFTSLILSLCAVPVVIKIAHWGELYDVPDNQRRIHARPIPRLGGIAIVVGFYLTIALWNIPLNMKSIYLCSLPMFAIGLIDDIKSISAKLRLFIQLIMAISVVWISDLSIRNITLFNDVSISFPFILGFILSVFIIVGAINSINMIDGLDGLAGGAVLICACFLSYIYYITTKDLYLLFVFSLPIIGALIGFLKYNTYPSTIFMGDSGSNWLGFMVGVFLVMILNNSHVIKIDGAFQIIQGSSVDHSNLHIPIFSILLTLSIPIIDTAHVIYLRLKAKRSPFSPDNFHFHHSLMKLGFNQGQSVFLVYFLMIFLGVLGILPVAFKNYNLSWTPIFGFILCSLCVFYAPKLSQSTISNFSAYKTFLTQNENMSKPITKTITFWETLNRYSIYLILIGAPLFVDKPPETIGVAAALMAGLMAVTLFIKKSFNFLESFLIACSVTVLLTANNMNPILVQVFGTQINLQYFYNFIFIWLIISTILFFIVTIKRKVLEITATDFLFILLPLLLILLPEAIKTEYRLDIIALRSLILFAALRTLGRRHAVFFYKIHVMSLIALAWVALTSLAGLRIIH